MSELEKEIKKDSGAKGFFASLANYYSDFLSNDFKKTRLPKRKSVTNDVKGRKVGVSLKRFPSFNHKIIESLSTKNTATSDISYKILNLKKGQHKAILDSVTIKAIRSEINKINTVDFNKFIKSYTSNEVQEIKNKKPDASIFREKLIDNIETSLKRYVINELLERLQPFFEKSTNNPIDRLIEIEDELSNYLASDFETECTEAISEFLVTGDVSNIDELIDIHFAESVLKENLQFYFDSFSVEDLFLSLREMKANSDIIDKVEFYLNIGEITYKNHKYPIFFIPLEVSREPEKISISISNILFVNKKALDFTSQDINYENKKRVASIIKDRIIYIKEGYSILDEVEDLIYRIIDSLELSGEIDFYRNIPNELKNQNVKINNNLSISLFDKSDESMMNDYEALLTGLEGGGGLKDFFESLITNFLTTNPINFEEIVEDDWNELDSPKKLVFNSPIPLAEEQRKILNSIEKKDCRFISVEGPPGTGKSHTISAIAFNAILEGKSMLVLSDTKEALDVVENKLNEVLKQVRTDDSFQNPILRLGKSGSNYAKLMKNATIESIKISYSANKNKKSEIEENIKNINKNLSKSISKEISLIEDFPDQELKKHNESYENITEKYSDYKNIKDNEIFEIIDNAKYINQFKTFYKIIDYTYENLDFNLDALEIFEDSLDGLKQINKFNDTICENSSISYYKYFNKISKSRLNKLEISLSKLQSKKGIFGYLFANDAVLEAENEIKKITGCKINSPHKIIYQLLEAKDSGFEFLSLLSHKKYNQEQIKLLDKYSPLDLKQNKININKEVTNIQSEKLHPLLNRAIKKLSDLFYEDKKYSFIIDLCVDLIDYSNSKDVLDKYFQNYPEYNYLKEKTKLEELNTAKLAGVIDERIIRFHQNNRTTAKTLGKIIRKKGKFPTETFPQLIEAFPCIIAGLRDYADYIPLQQNLFDITIIDEASQVSIAQALPAILRSKKMIVLGDRQQFSNVKTSQASKEVNNAYQKNLNKEFKKSFSDAGSEMIERTKTFDVTNSVMDFFEMVSNYNTMLRKHFRSYPEMISFSSKYFYKGKLQPMKILNKPIVEVIEFNEVPNDKIDPYKNVNSYECDFIIEELLRLIKLDEPPTVAIITPFNDQQTFISKKVYENEKIDDFLQKLKLRIFTFDTCQGEERDVIYYSMVASKDKDKLNTIFPKSILEIDDDELDRNKRLQRLNVGFSRAKEKISFILSKSIDEYTGSIGETLRHYNNVLQTAKVAPTVEDTDKNSPMEGKLLNWIKQSSIFNELGDKCRLETQFRIGDYLKSLDPNYNNPRYVVDFLLLLTGDDGKRFNVIIEYDGMTAHFRNLDEIDEGNYQYYLKEEDVEREKILESYGYHMIRVNKFNIGKDPITTIDNRIRKIYDQLLSDNTQKLIKDLKNKSLKDKKGVEDGTVKLCKKCDRYLNIKEYFTDDNLKSGIGIVCKDCKVPRDPYFSGYRRRRYRRRW